MAGNPLQPRTHTRSYSKRAPATGGGALLDRRQALLPAVRFDIAQLPRRGASHKVLAAVSRPLLCVHEVDFVSTTLSLAIDSVSHTQPCTHIHTRAHAHAPPTCQVPVLVKGGSVVRLAARPTAWPARRRETRLFGKHTHPQEGGNPSTRVPDSPCFCYRS